jgi:colanic acid biosynthesis protein WcaH
MTRLTDAEFATLAALGPIVSVDLLIQDGPGRGKTFRTLLGRRSIEPAKGYWFTPGRRLERGETLAQAVVRLAGEELDMHILAQNATFHSVREHIWTGQGANRHYIVIVYRLLGNVDARELPVDRGHSEFRWFTRAELYADPEVHRYVKDLYG